MRAGADGGGALTVAAVEGAGAGGELMGSELGAAVAVEAAEECAAGDAVPHPARRTNKNQCEKRAAHCQRLAEQAETPQSRKILMATAQRWRDLAEEAALEEQTLPFLLHKPNP